MVQLLYATYMYNSVYLEHYDISLAKVGNDGINFDTEKCQFITFKNCKCINENGNSTSGSQFLLRYRIQVITLPSLLGLST